jgi:hypothetical protein
MAIHMRSSLTKKALPMQIAQIADRRQMRSRVAVSGRSRSFPAVQVKPVMKTATVKKWLRPVLISEGEEI